MGKTYPKKLFKTARKFAVFLQDSRGQFNRIRFLIRY